MDGLRKGPLDEGTAYGRKPQHHDAEITEVAPGTPGGEFMRRYWHPIALSEKVGPRPQNVRILGEDLVLFRDRAGRPAGAALPALRPSRHDALLRPRRE